MDFKQALIAHLQGEAVEAQSTCPQPRGAMPHEWAAFLSTFGSVTFDDLHRMPAGAYLFRIKPRTVTINGIECVAPETVTPADGTEIWAAHPAGEKWFLYGRWENIPAFRTHLQRGLVFLREEDAVAYAKAMCGQKV